MAVCDSYYTFVMVDVGTPGSNNDAPSFRNSKFGEMLLDKTLKIPKKKFLPGTDIPFPRFFVADQAFPPHQNIMRPYPGFYLGENKNIFNYRLSRARRTIENTFGILAQRWRRLRNPIIVNVDTCEKIILATIVLHNLIQKGEEDIPIEEIIAPLALLTPLMKAVTLKMVLGGECLVIQSRLVNWDRIILPEIISEIVIS
ncbi:hypothetical protein JTB14_030204 [Gonioctena quinquepunctata]|nr:hypothetical protein JTB14_030204 [Gonioctena quinquepunctata]